LPNALPAASASSAVSNGVMILRRFSGVPRLSLVRSAHKCNCANILFEVVLDDLALEQIAIRFLGIAVHYGALFRHTHQFLNIGNRHAELCRCAEFFGDLVSLKHHGTFFAQFIAGPDFVAVRIVVDIVDKAKPLRSLVACNHDTLQELKSASGPHAMTILFAIWRFTLFQVLLFAKLNNYV
jgi:hypothetical protein